MLFGHLTVTYSIAQPLKNRLPGFKSAWPLVLGAYLPDLMDKPLFVLAGVASRGFGHSAVIMSLVFYLLIRGFPVYRNFLFTLAAGTALHMLQDLAEPVIILWPLYGPWPDELSSSILVYAKKYFSGNANPTLLYIELASYPVFLYFVIKKRFAGLPEAAGETAVPETENVT